MITTVKTQRFAIQYADGTFVTRADGKRSTYKSEAHAEKERAGWAAYPETTSWKHKAMRTAKAVPAT